jgi:hypothetical protein
MLVLLGLATFLLTGCALDTFADCRNLCERYADCFDPDADVDGCTSRCESRVTAGERDRADACDACLDGQPTCVGAVASCSDECATLLAP